jgi:glucan phosphoethanolaminetransferase (alkaline phosphatase superfamily)
MLKRGSKGWAVWNIVEAIILAAIGVLCVIYNDNADLHKWILIILGILVIVDASCRLLFDVLGVFKTPVGTLVSTNYAAVLTGAFEMAIGIAVIMIGNSDNNQNDVIFQFIGNFVGITLIAIGALVAIYAIIFMVRKAQNVVTSIVQIVVAALFITLGILSIIFLRDKSKAMSVALITLGVILMIAGIVLLAGTIMILKSNHDLKKATVAKKKDEAKPAEEKKPADDKKKDDSNVIEADAKDNDPKQIEAKKDDEKK